jgi:hypothetical protein
VFRRKDKSMLIARRSLMVNGIVSIMNNDHGYKKPTITEIISLNRLCWLGYVQRMEENRIPKRVLYMNLEAKRLRGGPRNRWQDEVREDGRLVGGRKGNGSST